MDKNRLYPGASCSHCLTWVPAGAMVCMRCLAVKTPVAFEAKGMLLSSLGFAGIAWIARTVVETLSGTGAIVAALVTGMFTIVAVGCLWRSAIRFVAWSRHGPTGFHRWAPESGR